jgi:large subunit ribosomal protein L17
VRHRKAGFKLKRNVSARRALLRGLVTNVIEEERITTTVPKAKAAKPLVEKMITLAKKDSLHARRLAASYLLKPEAVEKLFETAKLELVGSELVKRAAERAARREEKLKQLREGGEGQPGE